MHWLPESLCSSFEKLFVASTAVVTCTPTTASEVCRMSVGVCDCCWCRRNVPFHDSRGGATFKCLKHEHALSAAFADFERRHDYPSSPRCEFMWTGDESEWHYFKLPCSVPDTVGEQSGLERFLSTKFGLHGCNGQRWKAIPWNPATCTGDSRPLQIRNGRTIGNDGRYIPLSNLL